MAFFDALLGFVHGGRPGRKDDRLRLIEAWGLGGGSDPHPEFPGKVPPADPAEMAAPVEPGAYDVDQWRRKLKRVLEKLPASEPDWEPMMVEARALNLGDEWVRTALVEEFTLLIRQTVADGVFTPQEHRKVDLARTLIGLDESKAEGIVHAVVAEAEAFFGRPVEGA